MKNPYITEIPEFLKKDYPRKSSIHLKLFLSDFWDKKYVAVKEKIFKMCPKEKTFKKSI